MISFERCDSYSLASARSPSGFNKVKDDSIFTRIKNKIKNIFAVIKIFFLELAGNFLLAFNLKSVSLGTNNIPSKIETKAEVPALLLIEEVKPNLPENVLIAHNAPENGTASTLPVPKVEPPLISAENTAFCSVLYYPGQDAKFGFVTGHADLEFEGHVYTFGSGTQSLSNLDKRIKKSQAGGLPFERFFFKLNPDQSNRLKEVLTTSEGGYLDHLDSSGQAVFQTILGERKFRRTFNTLKNSKIPMGYTCMDFVSNVLHEAGIIQIPKIIKLSPLLTSIYLRSIRCLGDRRLDGVTNYGNSFGSLRNFLFVNGCRLGEIVALSSPILAGLWYSL